MSGISGNTIQNIAQAQLAHAASFQSYGNFISDQYGTRKTPPSQAAVTGGGDSGPDPRYQPYMPITPSYGLQTNMALTMMGGARSGLDTGLGGLATLGAFGMAPRIFDPFTSTLGAAASGFGWGGAAGALGYGAMAAGAYMGGGALLNAGLGQIMGGAQEQAQLSSVFGGGWNRMNMPGIGMSMPSFGQQAQFGNMMAGMTAGDPGLSMGGLQGLLAQGMAGGSFRGATSMGDFTSRFRQLTDEVRSIAELFSTSLNDAYSVMQRVQGMGFYRPGEAGMASAAFRGLSSAVGMQADQMMGAAGMGADLWTDMGGSRRAGARVMTSTVAQLSSLVASGSVNSEALRDMFGGAPINDAIVGMSGRLAQYGQTFAGTQYGQKFLGAMMDPTTGHIDPSRAHSVSGMGWADIEQQYNVNMRTRGARQALTMGAGRLGREMTELAGPQWAAQGIGALAHAKGGGVSAMEDYMSAIYGNIPQEELQIMSNMASFGPELKTFLKIRGDEALRQGLDEARTSKSMSWDTMKHRLKNAFVEPFTAPLRKFGREVLGGMQDWTGELIDDFMGNQPGLIRDPFMQGLRTQGMLGMAGGLPSARMAATLMGGQGGGQFPSIGGGIGSLIGGWMPGGLTNVMTGGEFGGLGGMALNEWNPAISGITAASLPIMGRNAMQWAGAGLRGLGSAAWGAGGVGGRMAGGALTGASWVARGVGTAARIGSGAMLAADLAMNIGPAALRGESFFGVRPADLWGGSPLLGKGGGLGDFGAAMTGLQRADPGGAALAGLGEFSLNKYPGLVPLGAGGETTGPFGDLRQMGFINQEAAQSAMNRYVSAMFDPEALFSGRLSPEEREHMTSIGRVTNRQMREGETLLEYSISQGSAIYEGMGGTGMGRDIQKKVGALDPFTKLGIFGEARGHFEPLLSGAFGWKETGNPKDARKQALRTFLSARGGGPGPSNSELDDALASTDLKAWINGSTTPDLVQMSVQYTRETDTTKKKQLGDLIYKKYQNGDLEFLPESMRTLLGSNLSKKELLDRASSLEPFIQLEVNKFIQDQSGVASNVIGWLGSRSMGPVSQLPGNMSTKDMTALVVGNAAPGALLDPTMRETFGKYAGNPAKLKDDTYEYFAGLTSKERGEVGMRASSEDENMSGPARLFYAKAAVYTQAEREFARATGREETQLKRLHEGKTMLESKDLGQLLTSQLKGTAGEGQLGRILQTLPSYASGAGSKEGNALIMQALMDAGKSRDYAEQMVRSISVGADGATSDITAGEAHKLLKFDTENRMMKGGGTGPGGAGTDQAFAAFTQQLNILTETLKNINRDFPEK